MSLRVNPFVLRDNSRKKHKAWSDDNRTGGYLPDLSLSYASSCHAAPHLQSASFAKGTKETSPTQNNSSLAYRMN